MQLFRAFDLKTSVGPMVPGRAGTTGVALAVALAQELSNVVEKNILEKDKKILIKCFMVEIKKYNGI